MTSRKRDKAGGARTPAADSIRSRRAEGPGLLSRLPGMAYQSRNDDARMMEFLSAGALALTGYEAASLMGPEPPTYADLIVAEDRDRVGDAIREAVGDRQPWDLEYRIRWPLAKSKN